MPAWSGYIMLHEFVPLIWHVRYISHTLHLCIASGIEIQVQLNLQELELLDLFGLVQK